MFYIKTSIGVEIRDRDLVLSCLQSNFSAGVFTHFHRIVDYASRDPKEVAREVSGFFKQNRLDTENIVLGIPRADAVVRQLDLPKEVEGNLKQVVFYQVQSFEPTEEDKFYYDYVPFKSTRQDKRLQVLLVLIRKSLLDGYLETLQTLGIHPARVLVSSLALTNLFLEGRKERKSKTYIIADLKGAGFDLIAIKDGQLVYSRGSDRDPEVPWKDVILQELELAASKSRLGPDDSIEKLFLAGEESEPVRRELEEHLEECALLGSDLRFEMPVAQRRHLPEATTSLALALSGLVRRPALQLDLLPPDRRASQGRWAYVPAAVLGLVVLLLLVAMGFRETVQEQGLARKLDAEIRSLEQRVAEVQKISNEADALRTRALSMEKLLSKRDCNLEILKEFTLILPPDTYLNMYQNRGGKIKVTGSSVTSTELIPKLEESSLLQDVRQSGTIFKDTRSGKDRFNFEATVEGCN